jgi:hypothetical protein
MSTSEKYENIQVLKSTKVKKTLKEYAVKNDFTFTQAIENLLKQAK